MRLILSSLLLLAALNAAAAQLPETVKQALRRAHIPLSSVSILVQEVGANKPAIAINAGRPMNPASTMKLLTSIAALDTLGPAYRWKTEAYLDGKLDNGVLHGNLVFKGYGDPKLTLEEFWMWLRELRQRGLRDIQGDVVLDSGYFAPIQQDPGTFDDDPTRAYNAEPDALLLNFNAIHVHLIPQGHSAEALVEPALAGYDVQDNVTTSRRMGCHGISDAVDAHLSGHTIVLDGVIPADCGELDAYYSLLPHDQYFFAVFKALWQELGGSVNGTSRSGPVPADATLYSRHESPELAQMVRDMNKFSNNLMARQLFLTLGAADNGSEDAPQAAGPTAMQRGGDISADAPAPATPALAPPDAAVPASVGRSIARMHQWLQSRQMRFPELVLENGSGLSRKERISARHLAALLLLAARSPFYPELEASLPILGMDGTVRKRFHDTDLAGYAHLKTGTLDNVKSLAGYVDTRNGKQWVVVFIINHPHAPRGQTAQDDLVAWVQNQAE